MNSDKNSTSTITPVTGFLPLGVAWGSGFGYFLADWASKSVGYLWSANPYPNHFDYSVRCFVAGPVIGLIAGLIVDISVHNRHLRKRLLELGMAGLVIAVVFYALIGPTMPIVRELRLSSLRLFFAGEFAILDSNIFPLWCANA